MPSYQDYINALLSGTYKQKIKVELLRPDETVREEITSLIINSSGNLNIERKNGIRRTIDLQIMNLDGQYIPNIENFFIHQKFMVQLGLEMPNGEDYWIKNGLFVMEDPSVSSNYSESFISIKGIDKFSLMDGTLGGELSSTYIIPIGTNIIQAIKDTLILVNDPQEPIIDVQLIGQTTPYTMTYETSDNISKIIIDLAQLYSCSVYYNENGQLVVEKDIPDEIKSSLWNFSTEEFNFQGNAINTYKYSEIFNSVRVIGSNIDGITYSYTAQNNNLSSNVSIPNLGFERIFIHSSDLLDSNEKCKDLAEYILRRKIAMQNELSFSAIPMYHLNSDCICTLTDYNLNLSEERFLIDSITIPLNIGGVMTLKCIKEKELILT